MDQQQSITPAFWFGEYRDGYTDHVYARYGQEPGWVDGESREVARPHAVSLGLWGYHGATTWAAAMQSGVPSGSSTIACKILLREVQRSGDVLAGDWKRLIDHADARREMRLFLEEVAERLQKHLVFAGYPRAYDRLQHAVIVTRGYARGEFGYLDLVEARRRVVNGMFADWLALANATGLNEAGAVREVLVYSNLMDMPWVRRLFDSWMDAAFDRASGKEVTQTCDGSQ